MDTANEKLDIMIDLLNRASGLYNDKSIGFIALHPAYIGSEIQITPDCFTAFFGDGKVYMDDEEYTRKEAFYSNVRFIALFKKEVKNNDCAA